MRYRTKNRNGERRSNSMEKILVVTLKDGHVIFGVKDSPILETVNVNEIESLEYKIVKEYKPSFGFKANSNYK